MTDSWVTTHDARPFNDRVVHGKFIGFWNLIPKCDNKFSMFDFFILYLKLKIFQNRRSKNGSNL